MGGRGATSASKMAAKKQEQSDDQSLKAKETGGVGSFEEFQEKYSEKLPDGTYLPARVPFEERRKLKRAGLNPNTAFQLYLQDNNDYAKPRVVSDREFDAIVQAENASSRVIYRGCNDVGGLTGEEMHRRFMNNDTYFTGNGVYGDGIYFGGRRSTAEYYAREGAVYSGSKTGTGSIMRAMLAPGAKVISYQKLHEQFKKAVGRNPDNASISAYARSLGYDAIRTKHPSGDYYTNVLNRGALIVSSATTAV